jgi:hypothetical protein
VSNKRFSEMTHEEIREMACVSTSRVASDLDWPAARQAIDTAICRARREIGIVVREALGDLPAAAGARAANAILAQVKESLDDIDQTIPPEEGDDG